MFGPLFFQVGVLGFSRFCQTWRSWLFLEVSWKVLQPNSNPMFRLSHFQCLLQRGSVNLSRSFRRLEGGR